MVAAAAMAGLAGMAACGGEERSDVTTTVGDSTVETAAASTTASPITYPANGVVEEVLALDNNYILQTVTITAGTEVEWFNNGRNDHNVIPEGDLETTSWGVQLEDFRPGDRYSHVFTTPGTYVYYCTIHGTPTAGMFGTIIVTEP